MKIWIDTATGTYGDIDNLAIADVPAQTVSLMDSGQMNNTDIAEMGQEIIDNGFSTASIAALTEPVGW